MELGGHAPRAGVRGCRCRSRGRGLCKRQNSAIGPGLACPAGSLSRAGLLTLCERFTEVAKALTIGALSAGRRTRPARQFARDSNIQAYVQDAVARGAKLLAGGSHREPRSRLFLRAHSARDVPDAHIMNEEPFAPSRRCHVDRSRRRS